MYVDQQAAGKGPLSLCMFCASDSVHSDLSAMSFPQCLHSSQNLLVDVRADVLTFHELVQLIAVLVELDIWLKVPIVRAALSEHHTIVTAVRPVLAVRRCTRRRARHSRPF